jgi:phenylacetic acid degradation operon negative regulatory protein
MRRGWSHNVPNPSGSPGLTSIAAKDGGASRAERAAADLLDAEPPRAARFIVTIYGDVAEPRGGVLSMGGLIGLCSARGISETLVRTAVSRLVAAGQLEGERIGRRSFYRLSAAATAEYADASRLFFGPAERSDGWEIVAPEDPDDARTLHAAGFARLGGDLFIGPGGRLRDAARFVLEARNAEGPDAFRTFAAARWPIEEVAAAYMAFLDRHADLAAAVAAEGPPSPQASLTARLTLLHVYRGIVLGDPRLPAAALPQPWPGDAAAQRFARLYLTLSPGADARVGETLEGVDGSLPAETTATRQRLASLRAMFAA